MVPVVDGTVGRRENIPTTVASVSCGVLHSVVFHLLFSFLKKIRKTVGALASTVLNFSEKKEKKS